MRKRKMLLITVVVLFTLVFGVPALVFAARPVVITQQSWSSSVAIAHVMKYVLENKLNIPAKIVPLDPSMSWPALERGSADIFSDVWKNNMLEVVEEYVNKKKAVELQLSYEDCIQGFFIPQWVSDKYGIKTYKDLDSNAEIFDFTGDGKGDFCIGDAGWHTTEINTIMWRDLGIKNFDHHVFSQWVFLTVLKERMRKKEPIIFYYWTPEWVFAVWDMYEVKFPSYDRAKWDFVRKRPEQSRITCGYPKMHIYVGISKHLKKKSPKAYRMFKQWYLTREDVNALIADLEDVPGNPATDPEKLAKNWVESHPKMVNDWIRGIR